MIEGFTMLNALRDRGLRVRPENETIVVGPASLLDDITKANIKRYKSHIQQALGVEAQLALDIKGFVLAAASLNDAIEVAKQEAATGDDAAASAAFKEVRECRKEWSERGSHVASLISQSDGAARVTVRGRSISLSEPGWGVPLAVCVLAASGVRIHRSEIRSMAQCSDADLSRILGKLVDNGTLDDQQGWYATNLPALQGSLDMLLR